MEVVEEDKGRDFGDKGPQRGLQSEEKIRRDRDRKTEVVREGQAIMAS